MNKLFQIIQIENKLFSSKQWNYYFLRNSKIFLIWEYFCRHWLRDALTNVNIIFSFSLSFSTNNMFPYHAAFWNTKQTVGVHFFSRNSPSRSTSTCQCTSGEKKHSGLRMILYFKNKWQVMACRSVWERNFSPSSTSVPKLSYSD